MKLRGALFGASALALLTGCSSDANNDYAEYFQAVRQSLSNIAHSPGVTRDQAAAIPYASMGFRIDGGPENLIVLATDTGGTLLWTSQAHVVIVTTDGRITRTVGLPHDLGAMAPAAGTSLPAPAAALTGPVTSTRNEDFPDIGRYGLALSCMAQKKGPETILILGQALPTMRVDEACSGGGWSFVDKYWIDAQSGFVWRSVQHLHPKGGELQTEIFRPPG